jgi:hypothetical protein
MEKVVVHRGSKNNLHDIIMHIIAHFSRSLEYITLRSTSNGNCRLWLVMVY